MLCEGLNCQRLTHGQTLWTRFFDGAETCPLGGSSSENAGYARLGMHVRSAIASQLATGRALREAARLGKNYVQKAIEHGYAIGKGAGPLDHFYRSHQERALRGVHEVPQHGMLRRPSREITERFILMCNFGA